MQEHLTVAMAQGPIYPKRHHDRQDAGDWCVLVHGRRLLTADGLAAKQQKADPQTLAEQWAVRLRQVLPDLTWPDRK